MLIIKLILILLLFFLSACFSSSETSFFSLDRVLLAKLRRKNARAAASIEKMRKQPRPLLTTILVGNELMNTSLAVLVAGLCYSAFKEHLSFASLSILSVVCGALPLLIFGEITPKAVAIRHPQMVALWLYSLIRFFKRLFFPVTWLISHVLDRMLLRLFGEQKGGGEAIDEAVFKSMVAVGEREGIIDESEKEMIHRIFAFDDLVVSDVMTPRTDLFMLPDNLDYPNLLSQVGQNKYSRVPIYRGSEDNIIGVIYAKDLLKHEIGGDRALKGALSKKLISEPFFIPAGKKVVDLFREFKTRRQHMAVVVDEYGGVLGLVTMEDLLEELFGEIRDEYDPREAAAQKIDERTYIFSGRESLDGFCRLLGVGKPRISGRTVNGLLLSLFGRLPKVGETVIFDGWRIKVLTISGVRVTKVEAQKTGEGAGDA